MNDVIYFSVNDWFAGRDYPIIEEIANCIHNHKFSNDAWCKENKLCVRYGYIDMSVNYCVSAPREWVEATCPQLLSDDTYTYVIRSVARDGQHDTTYTKKYSDFLCYPDDDGCVEDRFGWCFVDYCEENFGSAFWEDESYYEEDNE